MATVTTELITAEEYAKTPDTDCPTELVRGVIVMSPMPFPRHGQVCGQVYYLLRAFVEKHDLGHVLPNDSGVITERDPDTVRGADVSFYSYDRVPKGKLKNEYLPQPPNTVFEVLSKEDRWSKVTKKVGEYLEVGVDAVCVLDPKKEHVHLHLNDQPPVILSGNDELSLPAPLDEFRVAVERFFE